MAVYYIGNEGSVKYASRKKCQRFTVILTALEILFFTVHLLIIIMILVGQVKSKVERSIKCARCKSLSTIFTVHRVL